MIQSLDNYVRLDILDDIMKLFFTKNPLAQINTKPDNFFDKKTIRVEYQNLLYTAEIYNHYYFYDNISNNRIKQLTIKLPYRYLYKNNRDNISHYFKISDDDILSKMPFLKKLKQETNANIKIYYCDDMNLYRRKICNIYFYRDNHPPFMSINLVPGNPITHLDFFSAF